MLDIKFIRDNPDLVKKGCREKQVRVDIDWLLELDRKKRSILCDLEETRAEHNQLSKQAMGNGNLEKAKLLKGKTKNLEEELRAIDEKLKTVMAQVPNMPLDGVPVGKDDSENVSIKKVGNLPKFNFEPKEHWELGKDLDIIDTDRAGKVAGSRFYYLKRQGALLEFALINLAFERLVKKGFIPVIPPVMIKPEMAWAMGYLQQTDDEEAYKLEKDNLYLTATSEQTLGAMHAGETFEEKDLPLRYVGFSTCFRREAGSFGKDTKGMLRVHQFDKIEMFVFCKPEDSVKEHLGLLENEEELMQALEIPYQVLHICAGDLGAPAANKFDIEAWMPGQNRYRETHSTSNCTDFQARRLNVRYKDKQGKLNFVHTLNGTAFSMRPLIAILENNQKKDGSIEVPKVLQKWTGFKEIKR